MSSVPRINSVHSSFTVSENCFSEEKKIKGGEKKL